MRIQTVIRRLGCMLAAVAFLIPQMAAADITGGSKKAGCFLIFKGITATKGKTKVECIDGTDCDADGTADGTCTFAPEVCLNNPGLDSCTPSDVVTITQKKGSLVVPTTPSSTVSDCAEPSSVPVPVKTKPNGKQKKGKATVVVFADSSGKPKRDKNKLKLVCVPSGSTTSTTIPPPGGCPVNGDATNPNRVVTTMLPGGSDLDNGWTGTSFNFPVIEDVQVDACLLNCDKSSDPLCDVNGITGPGTFNSPTLGPPLPLVAGGVAVCVVNNWQTQGSNGFTGTANLQTGESTLDIKLFSDVYITNRTNVCPRCETGSCSGGPNQGKPCTVHGKTRVEETFAPNKIFQLSRDCPPASDQFLARLDIQLTPTTGTETTPGSGGSKPCRDQESKGVPAQDDACGGQKCSVIAGNCSGASCVTTVPNPTDPAQQICVDAKGGLAQNCCNGNTAVSCHPTFPASGANPAGPGIVRTGRPVAASTPSPWGDDAYPKTADGVVLVSTFCEPPTGTGTVDIVTGLPGPGALIFNTRAEVSVAPTQ